MQERLNSEMAIASSRLREAEERNHTRFIDEYPSGVPADYFAQAKMFWYLKHPFSAGMEQKLSRYKEHLEVISVMLSEYIEELLLAQ